MLDIPMLMFAYVLFGVSKRGLWVSERHRFQQNSLVEEHSVGLLPIQAPSCVFTQKLSRNPFKAPTASHKQKAWPGNPKP